jgi:hypothetical protein
MLRELIGGDATTTLDAGVRELEEFIAEVGGGRIGPVERRGDTFYVRLVARDGEDYVLRIQIQVGSYLEQPPRCGFVDAGYEATDRAWPRPDPRGPFRSPNFICTPPTAEFYRYHRERRYTDGEGSLVNTVATVFAALHAPQYMGRWRPR